MALVDFGVTDSRRTYVSETDYTTRRGADELKAKIEAYWAARGQPVTLRIVERGFHPTVRHGRWDIISNLINGLPSNKPLAPFANTCIDEE
jgi:hypothetical protein